MLSLGEVLTGLKGCTTDKERVEFLQNVGPRYVSTLRAVLKCVFDPSVKFALPEGAPPYKKKDDEPGALFHAVKKLHILTEGGYPGLSQMRRESLFTGLLESLTDEDAVLVLAMKDKKFPYPGVNRKVALKAFPDLF